MFQHFLITRFNLKLAEWQSTKTGESVVSEKWLHKRFELFHNYCLPSVQQQSNQNFKWLVCFDSETPSEFKSEIKNISVSYDNFIPVYIHPASDFLTEIKLKINSLVKETDTHIITSRLDNDDAIHKSFIETIQRHFIAKSTYVIDIAQGFQFIPNRKRPVLRKMNARLNPFISVVEPKESFETILSRQHLEWETVANVSMETKRLWMQIIHDQNISNAEKINFSETNNCDLSHFGISNSTPLKSDHQIFLSHLSNIWKRILIKLKIVSLPN